jgi:DNA polymerase I-like protein with 3'-5' exonuclease and polymerase domains
MGIGTTAPKKASFCEEALHSRIVALCTKLDIPVQRTDPSLSNPDGNVQADEKVIAKLAPHDPVFAEYQHYQGLRQIATKELPAMRAPFVHFNYMALVSSYRTSSSGNRKSRAGSPPPYPATNGQNINPKVRNAYVPRPGHIFLSADYDRLELCTLAQKCIDLFGGSLMADKINAGVDLHAYLGAQIALKLDASFGPACAGFESDADKVYRAFQACESGAPELYKKYRKLAKPTGLGFPGGLGPARFVGYAGGKKYGVRVTEDEARALREIWHATYPEMRAYFRWINEHCTDPNNMGPADEVTGERKQLYCYWSPLGLYCAGVNYTDACNGAGMQTFASDGFGLAVFNVVRACQDPSMGSVLFGCHVLAEIHDEIILEILWHEDKILIQAQADELRSIMEASMRQVVTDVKIAAKPLLMHRWDSDAEPTFDAGGKLIPWTQKEAIK